MHLTLCSCPARGYLACSLEPPGVKLPTSRVLTGARSTSWAVRVKGWRWDSGAGAGRQLQPSCCLHWLRDASSFPLISSGVCSLCEYAAVLLWWVAEAVMIKQAVIIMKNPLHPLHHLLDSLTGNFAAWHSARIACIHQWDKRLNLNSRTELKPFALLLNCSCHVQIVVQFQSDTKICWWL